MFFLNYIFLRVSFPARFEPGMPARSAVNPAANMYTLSCPSDLGLRRLVVFSEFIRAAVMASYQATLVGITKSSLITTFLSMTPFSQIPQILSLFAIPWSLRRRPSASYSSS